MTKAGLYILMMRATHYSDINKARPIRLFLFVIMYKRVIISITESFLQKMP